MVRLTTISAFIPPLLHPFLAVLVLVALCRTVFELPLSAGTKQVEDVRAYAWEPRYLDLQRYPDAQCLDGSPALYYFRRGTHEDRSKFVIFFEGGAFCFNDEDCAARASDYLGSTDPRFEQRINFARPSLDTSPEENPLMANWNHVFVRYCDGAYWSGERHNAVHVGERLLHYKGKYILEALFNDLKSQEGLDGATDVVLSGCSAGAIHVFVHLDAMRSLLPSVARVTGFPDSGFYLDIPRFTSMKRFVVDAHGQNASALLSARCLEHHAGEPEKCLVSGIAWRYVQTPLFAWQSRYDSDNLACQLDRETARSGDCVNYYGTGVAQEASSLVEAAPHMGIFLDSCSRHCQLGCPAIGNAPRDDTQRVTPLQAFAAWYAGKGPRFYEQEARFPCHDCCSPATALEYVGA